MRRYAGQFLALNWTDELQATLLKLLTPRMRQMLRPDASFTQTRKAALFTDGLNQVAGIWKTRFFITHLGIRRPQWTFSPSSFKLPDQVEISFDLSDFRDAARTLQGSADVGAQLLCALLRSAGVTARLVCSLQPLPFTAAGVSSTPQKDAPKKPTVYITTPDADEDTGSETPVSASDAFKAAGSPVMPRRITRIGQSSISTGVAKDLGRPPPGVAKPRQVPKPSYPVYWVEAFNEAQQKWISVDLTATLTIGRPSRLEPPFNDSVNCMSYVIAFEADGSAKDVTRRYAKAYNAKTRKLRVDSTEGGEKWLRKALKLFRRRLVLDRDQVEDAELARKEAAEGMPRNVQDFKNHPYYVLERHLRHNEIINPMHEVGKVNAGTAASGKLEPVYRRKDVHVVRSADKWYRMGREVKAGEQPLKHAKPRKTRTTSLTAGEFGEEDDAGVALYAAFQTEPYIPPPVIDGLVPRNAYGNLDVYVPSMVPPGGAHIRSPDAVKAARVVGVDYVEAVTGFKFQGRHGTAIIEGIVVAAEYRDAVGAVIRGFQDAREEVLEKKRSAEALRLWRRFLVGLRIVERMEEYRDDDDREANVQDEMDKFEEDVAEEGGGGFFFEPDMGAPAEPTATATAPKSQMADGKAFFGFEGVELKPIERPTRRLLALDEDSDEADLQRSMTEDYLSAANAPTVINAPAPQLSIAPHLPTDEVEEGGGFIMDGDRSPNGSVEDGIESGGGFLAEEYGSPYGPMGDGIESGSGFTAASEANEAPPLLEQEVDSAGDPLPTDEPVEHPQLDMVEAGPVATTNGVPQEAAPPPDASTQKTSAYLNDENMGYEAADAMALDGASEMPTKDSERPTSEDDRQSLLSHDPEDDDADADWI